MKRIPFILFCALIAITSCQKEKIEPKSTVVEEPSVLGSKMLGTWSIDSVSLIRTVDGHLWLTDSTTGGVRVINYKSDSTYHESYPGSTASHDFILNDAAQSFRYKNANGVMGTDVYSIILLDEHHMTIKYYPDSATTKVLYFSR